MEKNIFQTMSPLEANPAANLAETAETVIPVLK